MHVLIPEKDGLPLPVKRNHLVSVGFYFFRFFLVDSFIISAFCSRQELSVPLPAACVGLCLLLANVCLNFFHLHEKAA